MHGRVFQRRRGSWTICIDLGVNPVTGKRERRFKTLKGVTKEEATAKMYEMVAEMQRNGVADSGAKMLIRDLAAKWLAYNEQRLAAKSHEIYETTLRLHVLPHIGHVRLADLRPIHIQEFLARLRQEGASDSLLQRVFTVLRAMLQQAVRWELVHKNPADSVLRPRAKRKEARALDPRELRALMEAACESPIGGLIWTAAFTGMRRGELLGLRWEDVDFENGVIHVRRNVTVVRGKLIVSEPKTPKSRRAIPMLQPLADFLAQLRAVARHPFVFARDDGGPLTPSYVEKEFKRVAVCIGMPDLKLHELRHTYATILLQEGVPPRVVQELTGHASLSVLLDTYAHVLKGVTRQAAEAFQRAVVDPVRQQFGNVIDIRAKKAR